MLNYILTKRWNRARDLWKCFGYMLNYILTKQRDKRDYLSSRFGYALNYILTKRLFYVSEKYLVLDIC